MGDPAVPEIEKRGTKASTERGGEMIYKWAFVLVAFVVQFWLSVEFFSRNSLGFVLDSLVFFAGLVAGLVILWLVSSWLWWYGVEVVRCRERKAIVKGAGGLWATIRRVGSYGWEIGLSRLRGAKSTLAGIITTVFQ